MSKRVLVNFRAYKKWIEEFDDWYGWVFRIEIVTTKPVTTTHQMINHLAKLFKESDLISESLIEELFEAIKLFQQKEAPKC